MSLSSKLAITDVDLSGKRVLIRVCSPSRNMPPNMADKSEIIRWTSMSLSTRKGTSRIISA